MTELYRYPSPLAKDSYVATIGNFDGIHLGHQRLLSFLRERKADLSGARKSILFSFYPHPLKVLKGKTHFPYLSSLKQRLSLLHDFGVDYLYLFHFSPQFRTRSAQSFINDLLLKQFQISHLVVGEDARVGHGGEGDVAFLKELLAKTDCEFTVMPFLELNGAKVGSGLIREKLVEGQVREAKVLLGRPYQIDSRVVKGQQKGRELGFPTANLASGSYLIPKDGVYATKISLGDTWYSSVTNVGFRPSFKGKERRIETHILSKKSFNCYGDKLSLRFTQRLRGEKRFYDLNDLKAQITKDIEVAKTILESS